jgi:hypothetical protein
MLLNRIMLFLLLALALVLPSPAAAQAPDRDAGQYVILSAQYGTEHRFMDVTQRLREVARHDMVFRAGNETFGADPAPGVLKILRILARGPRGQVQTFDYREGSMVDGALFRGWNRGEWGNGQADEGEFLILSAQYGTERRHVDVTRRLKELASADRIFRMGNASFGVDPDFGKLKTLRIYARGLDGRERMFEYVEGGLVDGALFRGWGRGEWADPKDRWSGHWDGQQH